MKLNMKRVLGPIGLCLIVVCSLGAVTVGWNMGSTAIKLGTSFYEVVIASVLTWEDLSENTMMTLADNGTTGTLTVGTLSATTITGTPSDPELAALAGVTTAAANVFPYWISDTVMSTTSLKSFGRSLIDDATAQEARGSLEITPRYMAVYNGCTNLFDYRVGIAYSADGWNWVPDARNPLIVPEETWEGSNVKSAGIVQGDETIIIYYSGMNNSDYYFQIGAAVSRDYGRTWTKLATNPIIANGGTYDAHGAIYPYVFYDVTDADATRRWKMWYQATSNTDVVTTCYAYSADGEAWTKYGPVDVGYVVEKVGTTYYFFTGTWWSSVSITSGWTNLGTHSLTFDANESQNLTANTLRGSAVVTVANTSSYEVGEYVLIGDTDDDPMMTKIVSVDSATQVTLRDTAREDYTTAHSAALRSVAAYGHASLQGNIWRENGRWVGPITSYNQFADLGGVSETCAWAYSESASPASAWTYDKGRGVPIEFGQRGSWCSQSVENFRMIPLRASPSDWVGEWAELSATEVEISNRRFVTSGKAPNEITGVVSTSAGSGVVTGSGTRFLSEVGLGDQLLVDSEVRHVIAVASNTVMTVAPLMTGTHTEETGYITPCLFRSCNYAGSTSVWIDPTGAICGTLASDGTDLQVGSNINGNTRIWVGSGSSGLSDETFAHWTTFSGSSDGSGLIGLNVYKSFNTGTNSQHYTHGSLGHCGIGFNTGTITFYGATGASTADAAPTTLGALTPNGLNMYVPIFGTRFQNQSIVTISADDTTPDVSGSNVFLIPGTWTAGHNITTFDNGVATQRVVIIGGDSDCVVVDSGNLILESNWTAASGCALALTFDGANWNEEGARGARTVTSSWTMSAPPAIGSVTPNTGKFSTLESTGAMTADMTLTLSQATGGNSLVVDTTGLVYDSTNNRVGIGLAAPAVLLEVLGAGATIGGTGYLNCIMSQDANPRRGVAFGYDSAGQIGIIGSGTYGAASTLAFWTYTGAAWSEKLRISGTGAVGIGTTAAAAKLAVNGGVNIGADEDPGDNNLSIAGRLVTAAVTTFTADDTSPTVAGGNVFVVSASWTAGHDITALDNGVQGQAVRIIGGDADCNIVDGANLALAGNWSGAAGATITLLNYNGTNWIEVGRTAT